MSWLDPVGPLPPGVYWRRRLVVLVAAILVIVFVWWLFAGRSGGGGGASPTPAPTISPTVTPSPTSTGSASPTVDPTSTATGDAPKCPDAAIKVQVLADPDTSVVGSEMKFTLVVTNTYASPCTRDVGAAVNEVQVASASDRIWSSDDCNPSDESNVVVLLPNENYPSNVTWDQQTSKEGCPTKSSSVDAGTYEVYGRNGDVVSDATSITITAG